MAFSDCSKNATTKFTSRDPKTIYQNFSGMKIVVTISALQTTPKENLSLVLIKATNPKSTGGSIACFSSEFCSASFVVDDNDSIIAQPSDGAEACFEVSTVQLFGGVSAAGKKP